MLSKDHLARDPLDSFTDREQIVQLFKDLLRSARPGLPHVLAVKGNSGTGKTFLTSYLAAKICPTLHWHVGHLSFAQSLPNFRSILTALEAVLKDCVPHQSLTIESSTVNSRLGCY